MSGPQQNVKGLVLTVGGTAEPIVFTIRSLRPRHVALVCSEGSLATAVAVKNELRSGPPTPGGPQPDVRTFKTDDEADLVACHRCVAQALAYLRDHCRLDRSQVRIDYTGGTKTMSAAAVLAAAPDGYQFVYVTGEKRNRDGLGAVLSGSEKIVFPPNPWTVLEEPELRALLSYAAVGQWQAALDRCRRLISRADDAARPVFNALYKVLDGLRYWDGFDHAEAIKAWRGCAPGQLLNLAKASRRPLIVAFADKCIPMLRWLKDAAAANQPSGRKPDPLVLDLLANADRHAGRGFPDEAALRLYRSVELCLQRRLLAKHGIDNSAVQPDQVPEPLRSELERRHGAPGKSGWKLGLDDSAALLAALGDRIGKSVKETTLDLGARNLNWLIHGSAHVTDNQVKGFRGKVLEALNVREGDIPAWPDFAP